MARRQVLQIDILNFNNHFVIDLNRFEGGCDVSSSVTRGPNPVDMPS